MKTSGTQNHTLFTTSTLGGGERYWFGFNGQEIEKEIYGEGNAYSFTYRMYDARLGRFFSVDPITFLYPNISPYIFAENDVIRCIDFEGLEKLIVSNVDDDNKTATLTIKKDIEIVEQTNTPNQFKNIDPKELNQLFQQGNTTLYVRELPENGQPVEFITKDQYDAGEGWAMNVVYDVNLSYVTQPRGDRSGLVTVVLTDQSGILQKAKLVAMGGIADLDSQDPLSNNIRVLLNPNTILREDELSPVEVIAHEVGFHNMTGLAHAQNPDGSAAYPAANTRTLESGTKGMVSPSEYDTQRIITNNTRQGRVDRE